MQSSRLVGYLTQNRYTGSWHLLPTRQYPAADWMSHHYRVWEQHRGRGRSHNSQPERLCVTLGKHHPYANSAGYQRLARFIIADAIGYLPDAMTHTHHVDGNSLNDAIDNLELISAQYHGRIHASDMVKPHERLRL